MWFLCLRRRSCGNMLSQNNTHRAGTSGALVCVSTARSRNLYGGLIESLLQGGSLDRPWGLLGADWPKWAGCDAEFSRSWRSDQRKLVQSIHSRVHEPTNQTHSSNSLSSLLLRSASFRCLAARLGDVTVETITSPNLCCCGGLLPPQRRRNHQERKLSRFLWGSCPQYLSHFQVFRDPGVCGLTIRAEEAFAETHTQTQEEDRNHAAHRQEDDHGRTHCHTDTNAD